MTEIALYTDLHMHTTASDGEYAPDELVKLAYTRGLRTIAVTDHDTTGGFDRAHAAAVPYGITVIPAVELSAESAEDGDVHMLGYFIDLAHEEFQARLADFRENRYHRGRQIVRKLHELGVDIEWEAVLATAEGAPIARPHIARTMLAAGVVSTLQEAFDKYLADDAPAHVARQRMTPEEAIDLIHMAGGAAVLAHPGLVKDYENVLRRLVKYGVDGVELNHPKNPPEVQQVVQAIAEENGLIMTGGSDFHRPDPDTRELALGTFHPTADAVDLLAKSAAYEQ